MKLRLTRTAARELDSVLTEIELHSQSGARNVQRRLRAVMQLLRQYPLAGQKTGRSDLRRMVVSPYPYIITYRVGANEIVVRKIRHAARRPLA